MPRRRRNHGLQTEKTEQGKVTLPGSVYLPGEEEIGDPRGPIAARPVIRAMSLLREDGAGWFAVVEIRPFKAQGPTLREAWQRVIQDAEQSLAMFKQEILGEARADSDAP